MYVSYWLTDQGPFSHLYFLSVDFLKKDMTIREISGEETLLVRI
jgi:hypothetical protein